MSELTEARTAMQHVSDILDQACTAIARAQADLLSAVEYAHRKGLTVCQLARESGESSAPPSP